MRRNHYLIECILKAKTFGFTDEEIELAVNEGKKLYEEVSKRIKIKNPQEEK